MEISTLFWDLLVNSKIFGKKDVLKKSLPPCHCFRIEFWKNWDVLLQNQLHLHFPENTSPPCKFSLYLSKVWTSSSISKQWLKSYVWFKTNRAVGTFLVSCISKNNCSWFLKMDGSFVEWVKRNKLSFLEFDHPT